MGGGGGGWGELYPVLIFGNVLTLQNPLCCSEKRHPSLLLDICSNSLPIVNYLNGNHGAQKVNSHCC